MISLVCFTLSALCVAGLFVPSKLSRSRSGVETYYVCEPEPRPRYLRLMTAPTRIFAGRSA
jgi:hypothetical protein